MLYYEGQGITQDYAKGKEWYGKAAKQGDVTNTISRCMCEYDHTLLYGAAQEEAT